MKLLNTSNNRVREPVGRSFGSVRGKFPSKKMGRMIHWESQLERDAVLLMEFSPGITSYREQPMKIQYVLDGKTRRYTPDFEITYLNGEIEIIEVKPSHVLTKTFQVRRFQRIKEYFQFTGLSFRIVTEIDLRREPLLDNLHVMSRYNRTEPSSVKRIEALGALGKYKSISFFDAAVILGSDINVWRSIASGLLFAPLERLVTNETILKTNQFGESNEKIYI